jgi:legumain
MQDLMKTLTAMADAKRFYELVFYLEACESGSMFNKLLPANLNVRTCLFLFFVAFASDFGLFVTQIYATTAATPYESSYAWCVPCSMLLDRVSFRDQCI